jgi:hypothetical protein
MSMIPYLHYDPTTGALRQRGVCAEPDYPLQAIDGLATLPGWPDFETDYVDVSAEPHSLAKRPQPAGFDKLAITADGVDAATLTIDVPFVAEIDGVEYPVDSVNDAGVYELALTADTPATYTVKVTAWPYLPLKAEITAK